MQKELYRGERYPMCDLCEPGIERVGAMLIGVNLVGKCGKEPAMGPSEPVRLQDLLCGGQCGEATSPTRMCVVSRWAVQVLRSHVHPN